MPCTTVLTLNRQEQFEESYKCLTVLPVNLPKVTVPLACMLLLVQVVIG